jgi:hypothetical protein
VAFVSKSTISCSSIDFAYTTGLEANRRFSKASLSIRLVILSKMIAAVGTEAKTIVPMIMKTFQAAVWERIALTDGANNVADEEND